MVQRIHKQQKLKIAIFFNSQRGLKVLKSLRNKIAIKCIFLAKKNLNRKILKQINKKYYLINSLKDPIINSKIKQEKVNLIVSAGFPYIFGEKFFFKKKKIDILNLHGGPVPRYRGGSPLVWQKIEGKKSIGISVLRINKYIDSGKVLGTSFFKITKADNIKDINEKSEKLFCILLWGVIKKYYLKQNIKLEKKKIFPSKYYPQRKADDSLVILKKIKLNNLIDFHKALVPFYEAPFLYFGQNKISLNKIKTTNINSNNHLGYIEKSKNNYFLNLRDKKVKLIETSIDLKELEKKYLSSEIFVRDKWLEKTFSKNCFNVIDQKDIKFFKNYKNSFIFLKTKKPINKAYFLDNRLKYLGENITYQKQNVQNIKYLKKKNISYKSTLSKFEKNKVTDIAYKNFKTSRFHLDNRLPKSKSDLIRKQWMMDHFKGLRGEKIFVQFFKKKITGFCLIKYEKKNIARIDLICIDKKFTNRGFAKDLVNYSLYMLRKLKKNKIIVSTQKKNVQAIKLYDSLKFSPKSIVYLYHYIS